MIDESAAFPDAAWFEREATALRRLARALVQRETDVDDLLQEGWLVAHTRSEPPRDARAWMRRVLANLAARRAARADARSSRERAVARAESVDGPDRSLEHAELLQRLLAELAALAPAERRALHAIYLEGRTPRDAAAALGINENTLRSHVRRGLASLRERLDRQGPRDEWMHALAFAFALERGAGAPASAATAPASAGVGSAAGVAIGGGVMAVSLKWMGVAGIVAAAIAWWLLREPGEMTQVPPLSPAASPRTELIAAPAQDATVSERAALLAANTIAPEVAVATTETSATENAVHGIVVDWLGRPVARAEILDTELDAGVSRIIARSGDDGRFEFARANVQRAYATAAGYAPSLVRMLLRPTEPDEVRLVLPAAGGRVEGRVISCNGGPAAGVRVRVGPHSQNASYAPDGDLAATPPGRCIVTDEFGVFRVAGVARGTLAIRVVARGCGLARLDTELIGDRLDVEIELEAEARVRGTVRDTNGQPVSNAFVLDSDGIDASATAVMSRQNGEFVLKGLPSGERKLGAGHNAWQGEVHASLRLEAGGESRWDPVLKPRTRRTLAGQLVGGGVVDFHAWRVQLSRSSPYLRVDAAPRSDGQFAFEPVDCERATISVFAPGEPRRYFPVVALEEVQVDQSELEIAVPADWDRTGSIRARLVSPNGTPAKASFVALYLGSARGGVVMDVNLGVKPDHATGVFEFANVQAGEYALWIDQLGNATVFVPSERFRLHAGHELDLGDIVLPDPGTALPRLTLDAAPYEGPFRYIALWSLFPPEHPHQIAVFRDRAPERVNLLAGRYRFNVESEGRLPYAAVEFDIVNGHETPVEIAIRSTSAQQIRVLPRPGSTDVGPVLFRMRPKYLRGEAVDRPWTELELPRVGDVWERTLTVEAGSFELEVDAGAAGKARGKFSTSNAPPGVLELRLE